MTIDIEKERRDFIEALRKTEPGQGDSGTLWAGWKMRASQPATEPAESVAALVDELDDYIARINGDDRGSCGLVNSLRSVLQPEPATLTDEERKELHALRAKLNTPELHDFASGVVAEAAHQRERWGSEHDAVKAPADWFWLVGYLAGKALHAQVAGNTNKALHHTISTAAALANWHSAITGAHTAMRPGIDGTALREKEKKA